MQTPVPEAWLLPRQRHELLSKVFIRVPRLIDISNNPTRKPTENRRTRSSEAFHLKITEGISNFFTASEAVRWSSSTDRSSVD